VVQNLQNREHLLELITTGNGEAAIEALYACQTPENDGEAIK